MHSPTAELFAGEAASVGGGGEGCCWAQVAQAVANTVAELERALRAPAPGQASPVLQPFDHVFPAPEGEGRGADGSRPVAVLYAPLGGACSAAFHAVLQEAAAAGTVTYAWRPVAPGACADAASPCVHAGADLVLPGYGVELALKNMEYNAADDKERAAEPGQHPVAEEEEGTASRVQDPPAQRSEATDAASGGPATDAATSGQGDDLAGLEALLATVVRDTPLTKRQLRTLGLAAAARVAAALSSPLGVLTQLAQNLPTYAPALAGTTLPRNLTQHVAALQRFVAPSTPLLAVNGRLLRLRDLSIYDLLGKISEETRLHATLIREAGVSATGARSALLRRTAAAAGTGAGSPRGDASPRLRLGASAGITWLNDLEADVRYARWPASLESLLMPSYPGRLPALRRNLFSAVLFFDPGSAGGADGLGAAAEVILQQSWPLRLGLVPLPVAPGVTSTLAGNLSDVLGRLYAGLHATLGPSAGLAFLSHLPEAATLAASSDPDSKARIKLTFSRVWEEWVDDAREQNAGDWTTPEALRRLLDPGAAATRTLRAAAALAKSTGIAGLAARAEPGGGVLVLNGQVIPFGSSDSLPRLVGQALQVELRQVQEEVYLGQLQDDMEDLEDEVLELRSALPRINPLIFPSPGGGGEEGADAAPRQLALTGPRLGRGARAAARLAYWPVEGGGEGGAPAVVHWLVVNARSRPGLGLLAAALQHDGASSRTALVLHSRRGGGEGVPKLAPLEEALLTLLGQGMAGQEDNLGLLASLDSLLALPEDSDLGDLSHEVLHAQHGLEWQAAPDVATLAAAHNEFARAGLGLDPGVTAVVTNGRIVVLGPGDELFVPEDFELLETYARWHQYAAPGTDDSSQALEAAAVASSILAATPLDQAELGGRGMWERLPLDGPGTRVVGGNSSSPAPILIQAVLDPLTKTAAQLAPVLEYLHQALGVEIKLTLNPDMSLKDLPLKAFYRFVLPSADPVSEPPRASFFGLPEDKMLTLGMDVPEPWLVEPVATKHDLDNILLSELGPGEHMTAAFELEALLVTGSAVDVGAALTRRPGSEIHPRGVKLELGHPGRKAAVDTLVMSNLGYFQLKAAPGVWTLGLAAGRSRELFSIAPQAGLAPLESTQEKQFSMPVTIGSLTGMHLNLMLSKDKSRENEDVLAPSEDASPGVWSSLKAWGGKAGQGSAVAETDEDHRIHVFTVSSGSMYERLQKIMILSAVKRTSARLKFWFIKNYMSPQMKAFVPIMALRYDFDYEFVTYKWPSWLHKQSEKQRIIWAYKILFLDVLFPLSLRKVIFCDSDQVVRADLAELWATDLQGAPYGYTPFCDTNKDMDGFRFWNQGFWKEHLRGHPYHISALYVVDLDRFRGMAAGDQLRILYEQLSKDPNSLANLDQDLPNYAQHMVPIHSLDQEWLWCETWCGAASRPRAKTIDLCNNPLTKEPKLQSARRIIAEWPALDREVEELTWAVTAALGDPARVASLIRSTTLYQAQLAPMVEGLVEERRSEEREARPGHDDSEL